MSATDLAREMDAPLSSMIDLLKCLSDLGYVAYDNRSRTYHPTTRLGLLGDWLNTSPLDQSQYIQLMEKLLDQTKETIGIFWQNDTEMKCVTALHGTHPIAFNLSLGQTLPMFGSAVGSSLLAKWTNAEIEKTYQRFKRQSSSKVLPLDTYMSSVEKARAEGYAAGYDLVMSEVGAITAALPINNNRWIVFSVAGLSGRIRQNEDKIAQALITIIGGQ